MQVYRLRVNNYGDSAVLADGQWTDGVLLSFDGSSLSDKWAPVELEVLQSPQRARKARRADLLSLSGGVGSILMRPRVFDLLGDELEQWGEFLPVKSVEPLFLFNPLRIVDALNEEHSELVRFPSSDRILDVRHFVLNASAVGGIGVFKLSSTKTGPIFVGGDLAERLAGIAPTGYDLVPCETL